MEKAYLVIKTDEEGYHLVIGTFTDKDIMYKEIHSFIEEYGYEATSFSRYCSSNPEDCFTYEEWVASGEDELTVNYSSGAYASFYNIRIFKGVLNAAFCTENYQKAFKEVWNE